MTRLLDHFETIICDLDGCLISGNTVLPGANEFVQYAGERLIVVSNNSRDTPHSLSANLRHLGLDIKPEAIILAGTTTLDLLVQRNPRMSIAIWGSDVLIDYAITCGLTLSRSEPDFIMLTRDTSFTYGDLNEVIRLASRGVPLIVSNGDSTHPGEDGYPVAETGALLQAVLTCCPRLDFQVFGKPEGFLYRAALTRKNGKPHTAVAIGDNPETDLVGANRFGIDCILLNSSEHIDGPSNLQELLSGNWEVEKGKQRMS